jgi:sugar/nucleoside kinase (ribokinase family)
MIKVIGLSNAMTDVIVNVSESELYSLPKKESSKIKKGFNHSLKIANKKKLNELARKDVKIVPAGSPANVIRNLSYLGMGASLIFSIGKDIFGKEYIRQLEEQNVTCLYKKYFGNSGVCYTLITPDKERTSISDMGVSNKLPFKSSNLDGGHLFHTSAYETTDNLLLYIKEAKKKNMVVSFDLADPRIVKKHLYCIKEILPMTDVLFITEEEAIELYGLDPINTLEKLCKDQSNLYVALKKGKNGSIVAHKKEIYNIATIPTNVINTNGAGDAYASGFLFEYLQNKNIKYCGIFGSLIASNVCSRKEPYLKK